MYEKQDQSNGCELYLPQKITSRECVLRGPKMLKIDYSGRAVPWPWLYGPGFFNYWAVGPHVKNSKMITVD